ncbi:LOW QUALITY PROTEIN: REV1 DNA repair protein REV1 [Candida maltosa Xu316]
MEEHEQTNDLVDEEDNTECSHFLRTLDDDTLIAHVQNLQKQHQPSFQEASTPTKTIISSNISSDPFNDGLDDEIINMGNVENPDKNAFLGEISEDDDDGEGQKSVGKLHEFGDYATYFHSKHLKQQKQDEDYVKWDQKRRKLQNLEGEPKKFFEGCSIYVNGHTDPSINEIHRLVILHGGKFISYLSNKSSATHIVCDRLTPRKSIEYKHCKVVKAKWIVDCVEKQELLDWQQYRLILEVSYDQKRLDFFKPQTIEEEEEEEEEEEIEPNEEPDEEILPVLEGEPSTDVKGIHKLNNNYVLDARHPDFLPKFFKNSRLHHLSMWKADLRSKFLRMVVQKNLHRSQPVVENPFLEAPNSKVIMHIDFDCFFATASCLKRPDLNIETDPIAVTHGGKTSDIASCNYAARTLGIKNGMWLINAVKLCPNLIRLPYDFESYERYSSEFYNYLLSSNCFDTIFPVSIDEVLVDATSYCNKGIQGVEAAVDELATRIRRDVYKLTNCSVSVGVSHNVLLARLALRKAKPNGQFYLFKEVDNFLATVSLNSLPGFGRGILEKLHSEVNSDTPLIKDILGLSKSRLIQVLGDKTGTKLFEYARGIDNTSIEIDTSNPEAVLGRKSVSVDVNFGIRFDTVEELDDFLMRLSKELYQRLISLGICGSSLTLRLAKRAPEASINPAKFLGMGFCEFVNKSSRLGIPTNDWGVIGNEVKSLYRSINIPVNELRGISITMTKLKDAESVQKERQSKLPFAKTNDKSKMLNELKRMNDETSPNKKNYIPFTFTKRAKSSNSSFDTENFDWTVFNALPYDIKLELRGELQRRGLIKSPTKGKTYLQQLLPTQIGSTPQYVRVIDSPTKKESSPKRKKSASPSPVKPVFKKPEQPPAYEESQSYDSSIINELPSSVKEAVLKDIEYKKKVKKFDVAPLKDKLAKKINQTKVAVEEVTSEWVKNQVKMFDTPMFLNERLSNKELLVKVNDWVTSSLDQAGPHEEDVKYFGSYLGELLQQNQLSRVLLLIKTIKSRLEYHQSIFSCQNLTKEDWIFKEEGIRDWYVQLDIIISPIVLKYTGDRNISVSFV